VQGDQDRITGRGHSYGPGLIRLCSTDYESEGDYMEYSSISGFIEKEGMDEARLKPCFSMRVG